MVLPTTVGVWNTNGNAICTENNTQEAIGLCSDGNGGAIIAWEDNRSFELDIYAQKVSSSGVTQWDFTGVVICNASNEQKFIDIIDDGAQGAMICWTDKRDDTGDIYAQRINASGHTLWGNNGIAICNHTGTQWLVYACRTTTGDFIFAWIDHRNGLADIYAQKVNSSGDLQWTTNGVPICTVDEEQWITDICSDGDGGAILVWNDERNETGTDDDIYAQRVNASGHTLWGNNGTVVCNATQIQDFPQVVCIGSNVFIAWEDKRFSNWDIYAQQLDLNGHAQWTPNGTLVCNAIYDQSGVRMVASGSGVILAWTDIRASNFDIYAQKLDVGGFPRWNTNGIPICTDPSVSLRLGICSDGRNGAIFSWHDNRNSNFDIYVQWIDSSGVLQWATNGVAICTDGSDQTDPKIAGDATGVVIAWEDLRGGFSMNIYAYGFSIPADEPEPFPWYIIIIILVVLIALIIVVLYLNLKKRRKKN